MICLIAGRDTYDGGLCLTGISSMIADAARGL